MAFGCALVNIRLAAFLSAVNDSCLRQQLNMIAISSVSCSPSPRVAFRRNLRCNSSNNSYSSSTDSSNCNNCLSCSSSNNSISSLMRGSRNTSSPLHCICDDSSAALVALAALQRTSIWRRRVFGGMPNPWCAVSPRLQQASCCLLLPSAAENLDDGWLWEQLV